MTEAGPVTDTDAQTTQGAEADQNFFNMYHHNLAMQALAKQYGPTVYDTGAAKAAEENFLNSQIDPAKIAAANRQNAGEQANVTTYGPQAATQQTQETSNAARDALHQQAYIAAGQLMLQADPQTGAVPGDAFDRVIAAHPTQFGLSDDPATLAALRARITAPGGGELLHQIQQNALGPSPMTGQPIVANGPSGSMIIQRNKNGQLVEQNLGQNVTPVSQERVNTANEALDERKRQNQFLRDKGWTDEQIKEFNAATTASNKQYGSGGATLPTTGANGNQPAQPASQPSQTAPQSGAPSPQAIDAVIKQKGIDAAIAGAKTDAEAQAISDRYAQTHGQAASQTPQGNQRAQPAQAPNPPPGENPALDRIAPPGSRARATVLGQAQQIANQGTVIQNSHQVLDQVMQQISPYTTGAGSLLKDLPGSAQTDLKANLKTLSAMGLTTWIQSLKNASGQTGIGRVLQTEANAAMTLYGNMEQDQSAKQLAFHAQLFKQAVDNLYSHSQNAFKQQWGMDADTALNGPRQQPQFENGKTYVDGSGNHATYQNGQWVPVK